MNFLFCQKLFAQKRKYTRSINSATVAITASYLHFDLFGEIFLLEEEYFSFKKVLIKHVCYFQVRVYLVLSKFPSFVSSAHTLADQLPMVKKFFV